MVLASIEQALQANRPKDLIKKIKYTVNRYTFAFFIELVNYPFMSQ